MAENKEDSLRIQTSVLNAMEKKVLVWLAKIQPRWITSDILTFIGTIGAVVIAAGYILSSRDIRWLWLSSFGFIINWYGDSLDGTLARVRKCQRPVYGYYIDHTVDAIDEFIIFLGVGLSGLMNLELSLLVFALYMMLTVNVSINAHLKKEFNLTYLRLGPTELRLIIILVNTVLIMIPSLVSVHHEFFLFGRSIVFGVMDYVASVILAVLCVIYIMTVIKDAKGYAKVDPPKIY